MKYVLGALIMSSLSHLAVAQSPTPRITHPSINFDKTKDLFIAQFDSKPDPDDIHSIAAVGSMLAHPDLHNIDFYGVQGTFGHQGWTERNGSDNLYIAAPTLMNLAFGQGNWTQAGRGLRNSFPNNSNYSDYSPANTNWTASVTRVSDKARAALGRGGKVYVMEAGNSDFTADWVAALQQSGVGANSTRANIIVIQHSNWNENNTTTTNRITQNSGSRPASETVVLNWVRDNTDYRKIGDGNDSNRTPAYKQTNTTWVTQAEANNNGNSHARALWLEAESSLNTVYSRSPSNTFPGHSAIRGRGVDFSDAVEAWYIFNRGTSADTVAKFWNRYVTNTNSTNGPRPRSFGGGGGGGGDGTGTAPQTTSASNTGSFYNAAKYQWDFGSANSPLSNGYSRVTEATTQGYARWTNNSGVRSADRGGSQNALNRDFVYSSQAKTFSQEIANGTYEVAVNLFDADYLHDNMQVSAEGQVKLSNQTFGVSAGNETKSFNVTVSDGQLDLEFSDQGGNDRNWVLNRIVVTRSSSSGGGDTGGGNTGGGSSATRQFDFGTTGSPLFSGYTRVSPDTRSGAFRWTNTVAAVDRGSAGNANGINRDLNYSSQPRNFEVTGLTNGNWKVEITIGDASYPHDNIRVRTRGGMIFNSENVARNQFKVASRVQNVTDGKVVITFSDEGGNDRNWTVTRVRLIKQ